MTRTKKVRTGPGYLGGLGIATEKRSQATLLWALRDGGTTQGAARAVLTQLILRAAKQRNWTCFPSLSMIADDTRLDRATVTRALKQLIDAGLIKRTPRRKTSTLYWILHDRIEELGDEALRKKEAAAADEAAYGDPQPSAEADEEEGWS